MATRPAISEAARQSGSGAGSDPAKPTAQGAPVPISAECPDAAPRRADNLIRIAVHAMALAAIVVFLAYYCLWTPLLRPLIGGGVTSDSAQHAPLLECWPGTQNPAAAKP